MVFPILIVIGVALLAVLVLAPALIFNIALFRLLTNPLIYWIIVIGLAGLILAKLGILKPLLAKVKLL